MEFKTVGFWDEQLWDRVSPIYREAFSEKGAKPEKIIRNMFRKQLCFLHVAAVRDEVLAWALTGKLKGTRSLLIDYLAVRELSRGRGIGSEMVKYIINWTTKSGNYDSIILEVESDDKPENQARVDFWRRCGFTLTEHVHRYIWVPETYQAMFLRLKPNVVLPVKGEELFKHISNFHKNSFKGA